MNKGYSKGIQLDPSQKAGREWIDQIKAIDPAKQREAGQALNIHPALTALSGRDFRRLCGTVYRN